MLWQKEIRLKIAQITKLRHFDCRFDDEFMLDFKFHSNKKTEHRQVIWMNT